MPDATVNHIPTMTGGSGTEALLAFYARHFIPCMPADTRTEPISRTVGVDGEGYECVVDEFLFSFAHDCRMDWMLPGLAPTGRQVNQCLQQGPVHFESKPYAHPAHSNCQCRTNPLREFLSLSRLRSLCRLWWW